MLLKSKESIRGGGGPAHDSHTSKVINDVLLKLVYTIVRFMYQEKQKIYCFVFSLITKIKKASSHITHQPPPPLISEKSKVNCEKFEVNQIVHTLRSLRKGYSIFNKATSKSNN